MEYYNIFSKNKYGKSTPNKFPFSLDVCVSSNYCMKLNSAFTNFNSFDLLGIACDKVRGLNFTVCCILLTIKRDDVFFIS